MRSSAVARVVIEEGMWRLGCGRFGGDGVGGGGDDDNGFVAEELEVEVEDGGEDEFPVSGNEDDSSSGSNGEDGGNGDGDGGVERTERFRVWVRRAVCFGPRN